MTVVELADVDERVGRGCARVVVCFGGSLLQSAFTRFPLCASHISEFGWASTVSHDARMLISTRCSARWQFGEHCPLVKSLISHPLMGVLYAKMQLSGTANEVIISTAESVRTMLCELAARNAMALA